MAPFFILGPPRSGTTYCYQLLSENFLFEYIDNLSHLFYKNLVLGNKISHTFFDARPHGNFFSRTGNTLEGGWHAPSECPAFWYQVIPKEQVRVRSDDLGAEAKRTLSSPIHTIMGKRDKPFLIKNLFAAERLDLIKDLFPNARFLIMKRDRLKTALSIVRERKRLGIPDEAWWSVRSIDHRALADRPLEEKVAGQIHSIEEGTEKELADLPEEQKFHLKYEKLIEAPKDILGQLEEKWSGELRWRRNSMNAGPERGSSSEDPEEELQRVKDGFLKLGVPYE